MARSWPLVLAILLCSTPLVAGQSGTGSGSSSPPASVPTNSTPGLPETSSQHSTQGLIATAPAISPSPSSSRSAGSRSSDSDDGSSSDVVSTPTSTAIPTSDEPQTTASSNAATPFSTSKPRSSSSDERRNLTIILSVVLGVTALATLSCLVFCIRRHCIHNRPSFLRSRMVTPIDDEEIASWRLDRSEKKSQSFSDYKSHGGESATWAHAVPGDDDDDRSFAVGFTRPPNSRAGLTDASIPGAEPFTPLTPPPRRHSSRKLQKPAPLYGHPTRSGRSSISGRPLTPYSSSTVHEVEFEKEETRLPRLQLNGSSSQSFDFGFPSPPSTAGGERNQ
ncbi:MAG: hypothetical protein M1837_005623 [Sclerophora amabilis]|nr:MAG: hypothetical protein M1837_005623 [Sclerophora amabilis]